MQSSEKESPSQTPIFFEGGFGYTPKRNRRVTDVLAQLGCRVVDVIPELVTKGSKHFEHTEDGEVKVVKQKAALTRMLFGNKHTGQTVSLYQKEQAARLSEHLAPYESVDIIAQSADAQNAVLMAAEYPEKIDTMILVNPAALTPQPHFLKSAAGVVSSVKKIREHRKRSDGETFETRKERRKASKLGGFTMASSVALSNHGPLLHQMRQHPNSPGVSVAFSSSDPMISPESFLEGIASPNDVDYILIMDAAHGINGRSDVLKELVALREKTKQLRDDISNGKTMPELSRRLLFWGNINDEEQEHYHALAEQAEKRTDNSVVA